MFNTGSNIQYILQKKIGATYKKYLAKGREIFFFPYLIYYLIK